MENLVARPLEEAFSSAPGVEEILSTSAEGATFVRVGFDYSMNLDEAANELRVRLDRRRQTLPEDMPPPTMFKFDVSQFPIMFMTVSATDMDPKELRHFVEKIIQPRMERVPGVAQFTVRGGLRREIHVDLNVAKLRALQLPLSRVVQIVQQENLNEPVGPVREGRYEVLLRTRGEFQNLDEIRGLVAATRQGVPVYMRDIATVSDSHEEIQQIVTVDGKPAVRLFVNKQSGANTVQVCEGVWEEAERVHKDYPNIRLEATSDTSKFIKSAISNVTDAAWQGSLLAVLVLLLFLRTFSSAMIIGIAIPVSVIATFALMYFNGFTLNTVSFGGLALGVGMLVDNGIVVLENIVRHREEGQSAKAAAIVGSREVGTAITASTLTTIAVFVPVVFMQGMSAVTFQQLAYVVSFALFCSLIVALTIVPLLCSRYIGGHASEKEGRGIFAKIFNRSADAMDRLCVQYGSAVSWALGHRKTVVLSAGALFVASIYMGTLIGVELQPDTDEGELNVNVELEPGTRVEITEEIMQRLNRIVREEVPEAKVVMTESGNGGGGGGNLRAGQNSGELRINLVDRTERKRSVQEIARDLRPKLQIEPGIIVQTRAGGGMFRRGSRSGSNNEGRLAVEIRGDDLQVMQSLAEQVRDAMNSVRGVTDVNISRRPGMPEMLVLVDRPKAASMGLNVSDVAGALRTAVGGSRSSMYRDRGDEYNILVRLQEIDRLNLGQVGDVPLLTPSNQVVSTESVVQMRRQEGPVSIDRRDQQRIIIVSGGLEDRDLGSVVADLDQAMRQITRPPGYEFLYGGEYEEQQKSFRQLLFAAILALILVYMVMAAEFESWIDPFVVLFSVPLASIGVVLALLLTNTTFNMQAFLGVIILVGVVVNNAIVLVDYANLLRREHGMSLHESMITAGTRRLRPILMTTITTVLGLLPMSLGIGEGGELQAPLARTIIGGLTTSTLITLVVIPVAYTIVEEGLARLRGQRPRYEQTGLPAEAAGD
jgi:HAE1 family hydrophobic/amphiphilic exporter-1